MNILILGGTGFIGSKLAERFASETHFIRVYSPSAARTALPSNTVGITGFIADKGEVTTQVEWADLIFHFVSTTNPKTSLNDHYHDVNSNLMPVLQLLEIMRNNPKKKLVFCSSGGTVYGKSNNYLISETHPKQPSTSYGLVKSTIEEYILYYGVNYGVESLILRPANVYGPKLRSVGEQGIISTLIYNSLQNKVTRFWVNLSNVRDYIFIDDFVEAVQLLVSINATGVYNIGSSNGYSLSQIINAVQQNTNRKLLIEFANELIPDENSNILDNKKIKEATGWVPKTKLEEGVALVYKQMESLYADNTVLSY